MYNMQLEGFLPENCDSITPYYGNYPDPTRLSLLANLGIEVDGASHDFGSSESDLRSMVDFAEANESSYVFTIPRSPSPFQNARPGATNDHNRDATEPASDTNNFHTIMFFYGKNMEGKPTWYYRKSSTGGDENSIFIDEQSRVLCTWPQGGGECKGRCLITQTGSENGKCRVPNCEYVHRPTSGSTSSSGQTPSRHIQMHLRPFLCPFKGCEFRENGTGFSLKADLVRHIGTENSHKGLAVAEDVTELDLDKMLKGLTAPKFFCPHKTCDRHNIKPFSRQDNLIAHRRSKHGDEIVKRKGRVKKASGRIGSKANDLILIQPS